MILTRKLRVESGTQL